MGLDCCIIVKPSVGAGVDLHFNMEFLLEGSGSYQASWWTEFEGCSPIKTNISHTPGFTAQLLSADLCHAA